MITVTSLKAEIAGAVYFNVEQKKWLLAGIDKALAQLAIAKAEAPKVTRFRTPKNARYLLLLQEWEAKEGCQLNTTMVIPWVQKNRLCARMISEMIEEFRTEMLAKGKPYSDFRMAFQTYLRKGYLSKPMSACALDKSPYAMQTVVETKGLTL